MKDASVAFLLLIFHFLASILQSKLCSNLVGGPCLGGARWEWWWSDLRQYSSCPSPIRSSNLCVFLRSRAERRQCMGSYKSQSFGLQLWVVWDGKNASPDPRLDCKFCSWSYFLVSFRGEQKAWGHYKDNGLFLRWRSLHPYFDGFLPCPFKKKKACRYSSLWKAFLIYSIFLPAPEISGWIFSERVEKIRWHCPL